MINSQRLEKYIHNKEWKKDNQSLLEILGQMTEEQRREIREMLKNNKNNFIK